MKKFYKLSQMPLDDEVISYAILELKYRGTTRWVCRQRTASGRIFNTHLTPVKPGNGRRNG